MCIAEHVQKTHIPKAAYRIGSKLCPIRMTHKYACYLIPSPLSNGAHCQAGGPLLTDMSFQTERALYLHGGGCAWVLLYPSKDVVHYPPLVNGINIIKDS